MPRLPPPRPVGGGRADGSGGRRRPVLPPLLSGWPPSLSGWPQRRGGRIGRRQPGLLIPMSARARLPAAAAVPVGGAAAGAGSVQASTRLGWWPACVATVAHPGVSREG